MIKSCASLAKLCSSGIRTITTSCHLANKYKPWPQEKIRRIGRRPSYWAGQGGKRSRIPYDKRYPLSGKDINATTEGLRRGGNDVMREMIGRESEFRFKIYFLIKQYLPSRCVNVMCVCCVV